MSMNVVKFRWVWMW